MKHPDIAKGKQGYVRRSRGTGVLNWEFLAKKYPEYHEHIYRIRKDLQKLVTLRNILVIKKGVR